MVSDKDDGGPAFPVDQKNHDGSHFQLHMGMTLRDYFAGAALQGLVSGVAYSAVGCAMKEMTPEQRSGYVTRTLAGAAYEHADAMLKARKS